MVCNINLLRRIDAYVRKCHVDLFLVKRELKMGKLKSDKWILFCDVIAKRGKFTPETGRYHFYLSLAYLQENDFQ